jgi:hypothetical protein
MVPISLRREFLEFGVFDKKLLYPWQFINTVKPAYDGIAKERNSSRCRQVMFHTDTLEVWIFRTVNVVC